MNNRNLLIALVIVILLLAGVFAYMQYNDNKEVNVSLNNSQASNRLDYVNPDYGFKLKLGNAWEDYRVFKLGSDNVTSYDVCLKTTDTSYAALNPDQAGYACPVSVYAVKDAAWNAMADLERTSFGEPKAEQDGIRFFLSSWQNAPSDLANIDLGIEAVKASFSL